MWTIPEAVSPPAFLRPSKGEEDCKAKDDIIASLTVELNDLRARHKQEATMYRIHCKQLVTEKMIAEWRLEELMNDLTDDPRTGRTGRLSKYETMVKEKEPPVIDSSYVDDLQMQLVRSAHRAAVSERQVKMVNRSCERVVSSLMKELTVVVEDSTRTEAELLNQVARLSNSEKRLQEQEHEEKLNEVMEEASFAIDDDDGLATNSTGYPSTEPLGTEEVSSPDDEPPKESEPRTIMQRMNQQENDAQKVMKRGQLMKKAKSQGRIGNDTTSTADITGSSPSTKEVASKLDQLNLERIGRDMVQDIVEEIKTGRTARRNSYTNPSA